MCDCLCLAFPTGCSSYTGPNNISCFVTIWLSSGCVEEGWKYPEELTAKEVYKLNQLSLV